MISITIIFSILISLAVASIPITRETRDNLQEAHKILEKYAASIRNNEITSMSPDFTLTPCKSTKTLNRRQVFKRLNEFPELNITTRSFLIENVTLAQDGTISSFSAFIFPSISVNLYEVIWSEESKMYKIKSEKLIDCRVLPIATTLVNDESILKDYARRIYQEALESKTSCSIDKDNWEIGEVVTMLDDVIAFLVKVNQSTTHQYRAKYSDIDRKYIIEGETCDGFSNLVPEYVVQLYRIAEFTGSRSVLNEIANETITLKTCGGTEEQVSSEEYHGELWYRFSDPVTVRDIRKYPNRSIEFTVKENDEPKKRFVINGKSKIVLEEQLTCSAEQDNNIEKRAKLTLQAEDFIIKYYEAVKTSNEELLKEVINEQFEIRIQGNSRIYENLNATDIFDTYPSNFPFLTVIGVHQWENGSMYIRTMGTGYQNYYQTVLKDGKHYMEYERREKPIEGGEFGFDKFLEFVKNAE